MPPFSCNLLPCCLYETSRVGRLVVCPRTKFSLAFSSFSLITDSMQGVCCTFLKALSVSQSVIVCRRDNALQLLFCETKSLATEKEIHTVYLYALIFFRYRQIICHEKRGKQVEIKCSRNMVYIKLLYSHCLLKQVRKKTALSHLFICNFIKIYYMFRRKQSYLCMFTVLWQKYLSKQCKTTVTLIVITLCTPVLPTKYIWKQCRHKSDCSFRAVWSGSALFAIPPSIS